MVLGTGFGLSRRGSSAAAWARFDATGGTIHDESEFRYHTFNSDGTFEVVSGEKENAEIFLVGGGGSGRDSGGGGGFTTTVTGITLTSGSYSIVVGGSDTDSTGLDYTASSGFDGYEGGGDGGSGGGGFEDGDGGSDGSDGLDGTGNPGGTGQGTTTYEFEDTNRTLYSGGGGGGNGGQGGNGGGGDGNNESLAVEPTAGEPNTGGGGGGNSSIGDGASGGSGIAIIRYPK